MTAAHITVSAVVLRDEAGRVLTVRKRGTSRFMLPGGKPEPGEGAAEAAVREAAEELGVALDRGRLALLGEFTAAAANEPDHIVTGTVFTHPGIGIGAPQAEIAEVRWMYPSDAHDDLAPMLEHHVLPALDRASEGK